MHLKDFRNYWEGHLSLSRVRNVFLGENAQGKTNLLEAIYVLCVSRSFRTPFDSEVIRLTAFGCSLEGIFFKDDSRQVEVQFRYSGANGKQIFVNHKKLSGPIKLIGQLPVVALSPDDYRITTGNPSERRRLFDFLLSQISTAYLSDFKEYVQVLKQRNRMLEELRTGRRKDVSALEPWDTSLVQWGSRIIENRTRFVAEFAFIVGEIYPKVSGVGETLTVIYKPSVVPEPGEKVAPTYAYQLAKNRTREIKLGMTLLGPHRDEFIFESDGKDLRKFGSRGQHKTTLIAIKLAEAQFIQEKKEEKAILLLDDVYSDLDMQRMAKLDELLWEQGQVFITISSTDTAQWCRDRSLSHSEVRFFMVKNGSVSPITV